MWNKNKIISSVVLIILGIMLIVMKDSVISFALTLIGVTLLISAIIDFSQHMTHMGSAKTVMGIVIIVFGWIFVSTALYVLAICLTIQGIFQIIDTHRMRSAVPKGFRRAFSYLTPIASVIAGIFLMFNPGGTVSWIFIISGILLVAEGVLSLADCRD